MNKKMKQAAAIAAAMLLAGTSAVPAFALDQDATGRVNYSDSIIEKDATGSITIHKIIENDGKLVTDDGLENKVSDGKMDVTSPDVAENEDEGSFGGKKTDGSGSATFSGSKNGKTNGNVELEGAQSAEGHTDARDNEHFDGDEYTSALPVQNVGFSYRKAADIVSVAGRTNRSGDNNDTTDKDDTNDPYSGVGTYYTNIDDELLAIGEDYGVEPEAIMIDGTSYYTSAAMEAFISNLENKGASYDLTEWTAFTGINESTNSVQRDENDFTWGDFAYTDETGKATVDEVPLGLYLIGETDIHLHDGLDNDTGDPLTYTDEPNEREEDTVSYEAPIIEHRSLPFLVSVPSTNVAKIQDKQGNGHEPGTVWQYDFDLYPKDQTTNISKAIVNPDKKQGSRSLDTRQDYQIGDTVEQVIWADAAVPQPSFNTTADTDGDTTNVPTEKANYTVFNIADEMSKGLSFTGVTKVKIIDKVASPKSDADFKLWEDDAARDLSPVEDYTVVDENGSEFQPPYSTIVGPYHNAFKVVLTDKGLAKLNSISKDSQVVVGFTARVNKDAVVGPTTNTDGKQSSTKLGVTDEELTANVNVPTLEVNNYFWPEDTHTIKGNRVYLFTHELDVKKDGLKDPTKASFVVTRTNNMDAAAANATNMKNVTEGARTADGTYLTAAGRNNSSVDPDKGPCGTGHLVFVKEAAGIYHLYDNTLDGAYDSLDTNVDNYDKDIVTVLHPDSDGKLVVRGLDAEGNVYTMKEIRTENGHNLLKDVVNVELKEMQEDTADVWKDGRLVSDAANAKKGSNVSIGGTSTALTISGDNMGIAQMEIDNYKAITLRTGGAGRTAIYLIAGAGAAVLVLIAAADRRKKKEKAA